MVLQVPEHAVQVRLVDHVDDDERLAVARLEAARPDVSPRDRRSALLVRAPRRSSIPPRWCPLLIAMSSMTAAAPFVAPVRLVHPGEFAMRRRLMENPSMAAATKAEDETVRRAAPYVVPTKLRPPHVQADLLQRTELRREASRGQGVDAHARLRSRRVREDHAPRPSGRPADTGRTPFAWVIARRDGRRSGEAVGPRRHRAPAGPRPCRGALVAGVRRRSEAITETGHSAPHRGALRLPRMPSSCSRIGTRLPALTCDETVGMFVERAPDAIQVVISSRHDPHLPIARLRAHGDLTELRARDLSVSPTRGRASFSAKESRASRAKTSRSSPTGRRAGSLDSAWPRSSSGSRPTPRVRRGVLGRHAEHLRLPGRAMSWRTAEPDVREFMVRSSILERLSAPLCDSRARAHGLGRDARGDRALEPLPRILSTRRDRSTATTISSRMFFGASSHSTDRDVVPGLARSRVALVRGARASQSLPSTTRSPPRTSPG